MTRAGDVREALGSARILAILRYRDGGDVVGAVDALTDGGVRVLEITVDTPGAFGAIEHAAGLPGVVPGGGTVTEVDDVHRVADAGGRFVVSPGLDTDVVAAALGLGLEAFPAVVTGTEVLAARRAGAEFFKLFPATAGPEYLRQLLGPFAGLDFVPTGGVRADDLPAWLGAGAFAVALGSDLAGRAAPAGEDDLDRLRLRARAVAGAARGDSR